MNFLKGKEHHLLREVVGRVHHLENVCHAVGSFLFNTLSIHFLLRNARLLVALLQLFMGDEVLCHDATDLFEVFEHG